MLHQLVLSQLLMRREETTPSILVALREPSWNLRFCGASAEEEIRRALGISNRADFVIVSEYLTRLDLIRVGPGGRSLTSGGRRYLTAPLPPDLRDRISRRIS